MELGYEHCTRSFSMSLLDELLDDDSVRCDPTPPSEMLLVDLRTPTRNALQSSTDEFTGPFLNPTATSSINAILFDRKYRRRILNMTGATASRKESRKELEFTGEIISKDFRNSYAWSHRQWILQQKRIGLATSHRELEFTAKIISQDAKNRDAWFHRQWILSKLQGLAHCYRLREELNYTHRVIKNDINNIFAWNQRLFIVQSTRQEEFSSRQFSEMQYASHYIFVDPGNECRWAYIRSLYKEDMEDLCRFGFYVDVLEYDVNVAGVVGVGGPYLPVDRLVNRRGCLHALNLILELLNYGYTPKEDLIGLINSLYLESSLSPSKLTFSEKVLSIVEYLSMGVTMKLGAS